MQGDYPLAIRIYEALMARYPFAAEIPPVAPRRHLRLLPRRRVGIGHRRRRHLHPREPDPSAHRLRLVPQGPHRFRAHAELHGALVPRRSGPASAHAGAPFVLVVRDRGRAIPEQRIRARLAPPHGVPAQSSRGLRNRRGEVTTSSRGAYVAAAQRAKVAIEEFDGAPAVRDALEIMVVLLRPDGAQGARRADARHVSRQLRRRSRRRRRAASKKKWCKLWLAS